MNIYKQFFKYISLNMLGTIGVSLYILADTFFISRAEGTLGMTALNLALPIYAIYFAFGSMIGIGSATRYALKKAESSDDYNNFFFNSVFWNLALGIIFALIGGFFSEQIMTLMGADQTVLPIVVPYARIFMSFAPFFMLNYTFQAFIRNDNDPTRAMIATVSSTIFNIIMDYVFMFPLGMGMKGAALATSLSPLVSILICCSHFLSNKNTIQFSFQLPSPHMLFSSSQLGISNFIGELAPGITTAVFNFLLLAISGNVAVAAYGVIANIALVGTALFNGISQGAQPLLSQSYGEKNLEDNISFRRLALGTALSFAFIIYIIIFTFTEPIVNIFNSENSEALSALAEQGLRIYFGGFLFAAVNIIGSGYMAATGKPLMTFIISIARGIIFIIACAFILAHFLGIIGIWLAFPLAELLSFLLMGILILKRTFAE